MQRSGRPIFLSTDGVSVAPVAQGQGQAQLVPQTNNEASTSHATVAPVAESHAQNQGQAQLVPPTNNEASTSHATVAPVAESYAENQGEAEATLSNNDQITAPHIASSSSGVVSVSRAPFRNRSKSMNIDRYQPGRRQKRVQSARNIRILRDPDDVVDDVVERRRSKRISIPTKPYNVGTVQCFVCKKRFRQDIAVEYYNENIACSFSCFLKQN